MRANWSPSITWNHKKWSLSTVSWKQPALRAERTERLRCGTTHPMCWVKPWTITQTRAQEWKLALGRQQWQWCCPLSLRKIAGSETESALQNCGSSSFEGQREQLVWSKHQGQEWGTASHPPGPHWLLLFLLCWWRGRTVPWPYS